MTLSRWWALAATLILTAPIARAQECSPPEGSCHGCIMHPCTPEVHVRLRTPLNIEMSTTPLRNVLSDLQAMTGLNMVVDHVALMNAGIDLDQPVTMQAEGVTLQNILSVLSCRYHLTWNVHKDCVLISAGTPEPFPVGLSGGVTIIRCGGVEAASPPCASGGKCCCPEGTKCEGGCTPDNCTCTKKPAATSCTKGKCCCPEETGCESSCTPGCSCPCPKKAGACGGCEESGCASGGKCCCPEGTKCEGGCTPDNCTCTKKPTASSCTKGKCCCPEGTKCEGECTPEKCTCKGGSCGCSGKTCPLSASMKKLCAALIGRCCGETAGRVVIESGCGGKSSPVAVEPRPSPWMAPPCVCCPPMPMPVPMPPAPCAMPCAYSVPMPAPACWTMSKGTDGICIKGPTVEGTCDRITMGGPEGCVVLEGHVHLKCKQDGQNAEVKADRVCVHLGDMSVQVGGCCPMPSASPADLMKVWFAAPVGPDR